MRLTKQYAYALLASIPDENAVGFYHDLVRVANVFENIPEYIRLVDYKPEEFSLIRETLEEEYHSIIVNFLEVLAQDGMLSRLNTVIEDYRLALVEENLLFDVKVYSAKPLIPTAKEHIEKLVENRWGSTYLIEYRVDKKILGGIRLEVNGAIIDTTFRSRIDQIIREVQHGSKR
jgi:ATP synthase F1 delta subunit